MGRACSWFGRTYADGIHPPPRFEILARGRADAQHAVALRAGRYTVVKRRVVLLSRPLFSNAGIGEFD